MNEADEAPKPSGMAQLPKGIGIALRMEGVSKRFPGTLAVDRVDFEVSAGEVHALVGENGAGKSTLMKMLAGAFSDYTGRIRISGKEVALHSPAAAKSFGIGMVHQELSLARRSASRKTCWRAVFP